MKIKHQKRHVTCTIAPGIARELNPGIQRASVEGFHKQKRCRTYSQYTILHFHSADRRLSNNHIIAGHGNSFRPTGNRGSREEFVWNVWDWHWLYWLWFVDKRRRKARLSARVCRQWTGTRAEVCLMFDVLWFSARERRYYDVSAFWFQTTATAYCTELCLQFFLKEEDNNDDDDDDDDSVS